MRTLLAFLAALGLVAALVLGWILAGAPHGDGAGLAPLAAAEEPADPVELEPLRAATPPSERPRESRSAGDPSEQPPEEPAATRILVRVESAFAGEPIEGATVKVQAKPPLPGGELIEDALTAPDGVARVIVPPAAALNVHVLAGAGHGAVRGEVAPLARGESRELVLRVPVVRLRLFHGRVVDAQDGRALAGVQVATRAVERPSTFGESAEGGGGAPRGIQLPTSSTTDLEGRFRLEYTSLAPAKLALRHPGYSELRFEAGDGHEDADRTRELQVRPTARLVVRVVDGGEGPVRVRLSTPGFHLRAHDEASMDLGGDAEWSTTCAAGDRCTFADLPARLPLSAIVSQGSRWRRIGAPIVLQPGETREVTWSLGGGILAGRLLLPDRNPAVGEQVMLLARDEPFPATARALSLHEREEALAVAPTDSEGRFELRGVFPGEYWIGAVPRYDREQRRVPRTAGELVVVEDPPSEREVELVMAPADLFVSGIVLDARGEPAPGTSVLVTSERWFRMAEGGRTGEDGMFRVGPLLPGNVQVAAIMPARSPPVEVQAGAKDVVLRLHARARIAGRIVDAASGVPQPAQLTLVSADARNWIQSSTDGAFEFDVTPGTFALFAAASGGRIGVLHPLVVEEEEERLDLVIPLEQGALVRVVCPPDSGSLHYRMTWKGIRALGGILTPGLEGTETVPAGELELLYGPVGAEPTSSLHLRISPGELRELELRP